MSIQDDTRNDATQQDSVEPDIQTAEPEHAEKIVDAFNDEYVKYYGKYVDTEALTEFISEMPEEVDPENPPEEMVWAVEDEEEDSFVGAGAIKFQDNLAELGSTIIVPEYRKSKTPEGQGVYDRLFEERLDEAAELKSRDAVDLVNTQLLADKSAATQHTADKHDFAVTGVYDKKFPVAYEGKGRVTVVDMLWADSRIENSQEEVYAPEEAEGLVNSALENIEDKRDEHLEDITREVLSESENREGQSYSVKSKAVDKPKDDPMNFAEISVVADDEGDYSWDDVMYEIVDAQSQIDDGEDFWVGISLDANNPAGMDAAQHLHQLGFEYAGFNPGKLEAGEEKRDALELQYRPSDETYVKQFVNEAAEFMDEAGIPYSDAEEETDYKSSQALEV
jgi:hypothetical protein